MRKAFLSLLALLLVAAAGGYSWLWRADQFQRGGSVKLPGLASPVRVVRDEQGVPYLFAASMDDALRAQGFVTAQDRLFDITISRYLAQGRLAEVIGEAGLKSDIGVRVAGLPRHARRHAGMLAGEERRRRELYLEGLNAYITGFRDEHPVGLKLLGIEAEPWSLEDALALSYFVNWSSSANASAELVSQQILDAVGPGKAAEISQLTVNPDDGSEQSGVLPAVGLGIAGWPLGWEERAQPGSNNWVVAGARSPRGAPIVANDPHIDSRTLPGRWHPIGLVTPELRAVGVAGPGFPGLALGRTGRVAFGITNSYGDVVDLYVERVDPARPDHYLEGARSIPFEVIDETLRVRDRGSAAGFREVPLRIRLTHRGPVVSDHGMSVPAGHVLSMRWSVPEAMAPGDSSGTSLIFAGSVEEARVAVGAINAPYNYVVADAQGNIGHFTAGRVPLRRRGDGSTPLPVVDESDAWEGMIPAGEMPGSINPARGWAATANHRTLPEGYPYQYSTYFAASWRYRRIAALLDQPGPISAQQHWRYMWDVRNTMAAEIAPVMAQALAAADETRDMAMILQDWDFEDDAEAVAPSIFHATFDEFARLTFEDELGPQLTASLLDTYYYWQERLIRLCRDDAASWFDDQRTPARETRDDLFRRAGLRARARLVAALGSDISGWRWGRLHTVTFFSPYVPGKALAGVLGGGTHPMEGSGETVNRAIYKFGKPYDAATIASLRFVADLADPDKVMLVLSGGASGRQFDRHLDDQLQPWLSGEPRYLWFSDAEIERHKVDEQRLEP